MKFLAIFFSFFALTFAQYYYEAPAAAAASYVNTYNSYLPYASAASYGYYYPSAAAASPVAAAATYPAYYAAYGSNKNADEKPMPPTAKLTNNA